MPEENLSIGRAELRAELANLELRLVDRFTTLLEKKADHAVVDQLNERVKSLELSRASREHLENDAVEVEKRLGKLERFRYAIPGAATLAAVAVVLQFIPHP